MADNKELKRVYRIEVQGIEAATKKVEQLNAEIALQTQIKKEAQKILTTNPGDTVQIERQSKIIAESEVALKKLSAEKRIAVREANALITAEERIAAAEIKAAEAGTFAAGSYKALFAESKRLNELYRSTAPTDPLFEKIKADAIAAQQKVFDFNRTLSSEGTLVGEYSRGIINAFKSADLGEILKQQVVKGEAALKKLDTELEGLKTDYVELKNIAAASLNTIDAEFKENSLAVAGNKAAIDALTKEYQENRATATASLNAIEKELIENRRRALELGSQLTSMKTQLKEVGTVGNQLTTALSTGFKNLSKDLINTAVAFVGVQAAITGIRNLTKNVAELSDQTTNLEIEFNKSAGGAQYLVDQLAKLNTRTKLVQLEEIANIAARAGVAEENLVGVVEAIDKVKVAFGKDFGDVEKGTEEIVKIISIFEGSGNVNGDNILKVGNAIRTLANESTASVPFLNDFAQRLAGLEGVAKVGLPNVLGLASGFEQFGQSAEVSSTVLIKLIPKLASDVFQFAKYAGLSAQGFKDLLESDPSEALLRFSEGIVKDKNGLVELEKTLKDSEIFGKQGGGRGAAILGVLGSKSKEFRESILSAKNAIQETSNIEEAFAKKNENFASVLDKISKKFSDLGNNKTVQAVLIGIANAIAFLLGNMQALGTVLLITIGLTNTLLGTVIRLTAAIVLETAAFIIERAQLVITNTIRAISNFLIATYTALISRATFATGAAATAYRVLAAAITFMASPLGIAIGLIVALTTVLGVFSSRASSSAEATNKFRLEQERLRREQELSIEVSKRQTELNGDLIQKIKDLSGTVNNLALNEDTRKKALEALIKINPAYRSALQGEIIDTQALNDITNKVIATLERFGTAKARAALRADLRKDVAAADVDIAVETKKREEEKAQRKKIIEDFNNDPLNFGQPTPFFTSDIDKGVKKATEKRNESQAKLDILKEQDAKRIKELNTQIDIDKGILANIKDKQQKNVKEYAARKQQQLDDNLKELELITGITDPVDVTPVSTPAVPNEEKKKKGPKPKTAKEIRDERLKAIQEEEEAKKKLQEINFKNNVITETEYLENINILTQRYSDRKLKVVLAAAKEEQKRIAEFNLDKVNSEKDTTEKIYKIKQAALDKELQLNLQTFETDPTKNKEENAKKQVEVDEFNRKLLIKYQADSLLLKNAYYIRDAENEKKWAEEILKINKKLKQDLIDLDKARLTVAKETGDKQLAEFKATMAKQRLALIEAGKSTKKLDEQTIIGTTARQLASLESQMPIIKKLYEEGKITAEEYYNTLAERDRLAAENFENLTTRFNKSFKDRAKAYNTFKDLLKGEGTRSISNLFGIEDEEAQKAVGEAISQTYDIAVAAMNNYYDAKRARIEEEKQYELEKLELEKNQRLSRAQSLAEQESIERQYTKKKNDAEKKAFEEGKRLKKAQAKIAFFTELANIWSSVWSIGNPILAAILGVVFTGLAALRYSSTVSNIDKEKFEQGGFVKVGGEIYGPDHAGGGVPFNPNTLEAEGGELAIINKRSANSKQVYSVTGTSRQIASAINEQGGGKRFAIGGQLTKLEYGGTFGKQLYPSDTSYINNNNGMKELIEATNARIDRIQVFVQPQAIQTENNKLNKAAEINTL